MPRKARKRSFAEASLEPDTVGLNTPVRADFGLKGERSTTKFARFSDEARLEQLVNDISVASDGLRVLLIADYFRLKSEMLDRAAKSNDAFRPAWKRAQEAALEPSPKTTQTSSIKDSSLPRYTRVDLPALPIDVPPAVVPPAAIETEPSIDRKIHASPIRSQAQPAAQPTLHRNGRWAVVAVLTSAASLTAIAFALYNAAAHADAQERLALAHLSEYRKLGRIDHGTLYHQPSGNGLIAC